MRPNLQQLAQETLLDSGFERQDVWCQTHAVGDDDSQAGAIRQRQQFVGLLPYEQRA